MTAVLLWVNLQVFYYMGTGGKREKGEGMGGREVGERGVILKSIPYIVDIYLQPYSQAVPTPSL